MSNNFKDEKKSRALRKLLKKAGKVTDINRKGFGSMGDLIGLARTLKKFNRLSDNAIVKSAEE